LLFAKNIIHITFGEDINDHEVELMVRDDLGGAKPFVKKSVKMHVAIQECFEQMLMIMGSRFVNPLYLLTAPFVESPYCFTAREKQIRDNCTALRNHVRQYIRARAKGEKRSNVGQDSDLLSLFLSVPDVFQEEDIIDEVIDFMLAGSQTT